MPPHGSCKTVRMARLSEPSPYVEFDRTQWRALRMSTPLKLTEDELVKLRGLGEKIDLLEVEEVYLPLARLIHLQVAARQALFAATAEFLGEPVQNPDRPVPFVIGVAGEPVQRHHQGSPKAADHPGQMGKIGPSRFYRFQVWLVQLPAARASVPP